MKFKVEFQWPSRDILPTARELPSAAEALRTCAEFIGSHCKITSISIVQDDGTVSKISERRLVNLARAEGCHIRYPPGRRRHRTFRSAVFAILCSTMPNSWGDFATRLDAITYRVAVRRENGRRPTG